MDNVIDALRACARGMGPQPRYGVIPGTEGRVLFAPQPIKTHFRNVDGDAAVLHEVPGPSLQFSPEEALRLADAFENAIGTTLASTKRESCVYAPSYPRLCEVLQGMRADGTDGEPPTVYIDEQATERLRDAKTFADVVRDPEIVALIHDRKENSVTIKIGEHLRGKGWTVAAADKGQRATAASPQGAQVARQVSPQTGRVRPHHSKFRSRHIGSLRGPPLCGGRHRRAPPRTHRRQWQPEQLGRQVSSGPSRTKPAAHPHFTRYADGSRICTLTVHCYVQVNYSPPRDTMKPAAALNILIERYPLCFVGHERHRRPIKRGILHDLVATGVLPAAKLSMALRLYCGNEGYLRASIAGAPRIDLEGNVAGEVTAAQAAHARKNFDAILERQMAKAKAKRDAANSAAHKAPDVPASGTDRAGCLGRVAQGYRRRCCAACTRSQASIDAAPERLTKRSPEQRRGLRLRAFVLVFALK